MEILYLLREKYRAIWNYRKLQILNNFVILNLSRSFFHVNELSVYTVREWALSPSINSV